jgi:hypothetical protein
VLHTDDQCWQGWYTLHAAATTRQKRATVWALLSVDGQVKRKRQTVCRLFGVPSSFQRNTALSFMLTIEALLDDAQHLASYEVAVQAVGMHNSSFNDWKALFSSTDEQREDNDMVYIILNEALQSANI